MALATLVLGVLVFIATRAAPASTQPTSAPIPSAPAPREVPSVEIEGGTDEQVQAEAMPVDSTRQVTPRVRVRVLGETPVETTPVVTSDVPTEPAANEASAMVAPTPTAAESTSSPRAGTLSLDEF